MFVTVTIVDENGVLVPDANHLVKFKVNGAAHIEAVDNGSPVSLEPFKASHHTAMNGKVLCILRSAERIGKFTLTASARGLKSGTLTLRAE